MLPPETTATIFLWPRAAIAGDTAAATAQAAGAFGDDAARVRPTSRIARAASSSETTIDSCDVLAQQRPHRVEHGLAAGAVDERRLPLVEAAGAVRRRTSAASGAAVSGSAA